MFCCIQLMMNLRYYALITYIYLIFLEHTAVVNR